MAGASVAQAGSAGGVLRGAWEAAGRAGAGAASGSPIGRVGECRSQHLGVLLQPAHSRSEWPGKSMAGAVGMGTGGRSRDAVPFA